MYTPSTTTTTYDPVCSLLGLVEIMYDQTVPTMRQQISSHASVWVSKEVYQGSSHAERTHSGWGHEFLVIGHCLDKIFFLGLMLKEQINMVLNGYSLIWSHLRNPLLHNHAHGQSNNNCYQIYSVPACFAYWTWHLSCHDSKLSKNPCLPICSNCSMAISKVQASTNLNSTTMMKRRLYLIHTSIDTSQTFWQLSSRGRTQQCDGECC